MPAPICFVLMPFGVRSVDAGKQIDFDKVYKTYIRPAILAANLSPLRADEEMVGGVIHKAMFERLILCEYAVADLTTANANVFYELGVRHAVRPWATIPVYAAGLGNLPFDVAALRALPYSLDDGGSVIELEEAISELKARLEAARSATPDSPVYQLVDGFPDIQHLKTDVFREQVQYASQVKERLSEARRNGVDAVKEIENDLGEINDVEMGVVVDLFLSYRAVSAWKEMVDLVGQMTKPLADSAMIREQLALALNRIGNWQSAEAILLKLLEERGPSSESYGILGRVYKDRWTEAAAEKDMTLAKGYLEQAINAYINGFQTDWRDAYPGINALTLLACKEEKDSRFDEIAPVVQYSVSRRLETARGDYWDFATQLELAFLTKECSIAERFLPSVLSSAKEVWQLESTSQNLQKIIQMPGTSSPEIEWMQLIIDHLAARARTIGASKH